MAVVITRDTLTPTLESYNDEVMDAIRAVLEYWGARAVTEMRSNASWTDRTSNARNGLASQVYLGGESASLVLFHTMNYGIWLEVRWSGRYAIIGPTLNEVGPKVLEMARDAIGLIGPR